MTLSLRNSSFLMIHGHTVRKPVLIWLHKNISDLADYVKRHRYATEVLSNLVYMPQRCGIHKCILYKECTYSITMWLCDSAWFRYVGCWPMIMNAYPCAHTWLPQSLEWRLLLMYVTWYVQIMLLWVQISLHQILVNINCRLSMYHADCHVTCLHILYQEDFVRVRSWQCSSLVCILAKLILLIKIVILFHTNVKTLSLIMALSSVLSSQFSVRIAGRSAQAQKAWDELHY